jgi:CHAT domain-containing protein
LITLRTQRLKLNEQIEQAQLPIASSRKGITVHHWRSHGSIASGGVMHYSLRQPSPLRKKYLRRLVAFLTTFFICAFPCLPATSAPLQQLDEKKPVMLELGKPIACDMPGGQTRGYQISATAGQYFQVIVRERGIDLAVALFAPDDKKLIDINRSNGTQGIESVAMIAEVSGLYRLAVRSLSKNAATGKYEVRIAQMRAPSAQDRSLITAQTLFAEGEQLRAHDDAESLQKAMKKYEEARALYKAIGDYEGETNTLSKFGEIYYFTGEIKQALDIWERERWLRRTAGDHGGEARSLFNMGTVYTHLEETQKALDLYNQALLLYRDIGDRVGEANAAINITWIYYSLRKLQKALYHFNQALSLSRTSGYLEGEARALFGIGATSVLLKEYPKALDYYNQALSLNRAIGARKEEAYTLNNLAWLYSILGEKEKVSDYNHQALLVIREVGDRTEEAYLLHSIGRTYNSSGEKQKAIDYYNQALPILRAIGDGIGEANTRYRLAQCERARGNLNEAHAQIEATLNIIESLRAKLGGQEVRANYIVFAEKYHEFYLDLLSQLHQRNPSAGYEAAALQISERIRARHLLELLTEAHADIRQGVDAVLLARERKLQREITAKTDSRIRLLNRKHTEQQATKATQELEALTWEYQEVEAKIRTTSPRYAALTQPQPLTLPEIQQLLDADTMLLEYALGEAHSYLWTVTPTSIESFELPKRSVIEVAAQRVYELLTIRTKKRTNETVTQREARFAKADAEYHIAAAELSHLLLAPVTSKLGKKRLVIVSDGALHYIPFAALPVPEEKSEGEGGGRGDEGQSRKANRKPSLPTFPPPALFMPLIVEHEIVNLPSASTLALLRRDLEGRKSPTKDVAIFADPVFEISDDRVKPKTVNKSSNRHSKRVISSAAQIRGDKKSIAAAGKLKAIKDYLIRTRMIEEGQPLARLFYSRQEAMTIAALVPEGQRKLALDFEVNYQTVTSAELGDYRFVHFATHGWLDTEQPELSGILLSLVDKAGSPQENGILRLGDVYNLKLPVDLVTLSACETALGKLMKGEGLVGLTRGFMYAGAARVLASLWKVEEAATAALMGRFYEGVLGSQRLRPAAALRQAQIEMWRKPNRRSPYFWSAFVLQGEWK